MRANAPADQKLNLRHLWQASWRPPYRRRIRWLILIDERLAENGNHAEAAPMIAAMRVLSAFPIILMAAPVLAAEPEPKCGVDMPHTTGSLSFDPTTMEKTGAFVIEGGLYREGEVGTCVA